jgi:thiosulfate reductase cytochrome b subunit
MSENKIYFYPIWLRIWHGINALCILTLIITGINMQFTNPGVAIMKFQLAVDFHNIAGITLSLNYLLFFFGNILTVNRKYYKLKMKGLLKKILLQADYYTSGMFKNQPHPFPLSEKRKFNPMQKVMYVFVMYVIVPAVIITGLALLFPETIIEEVYSISGIFITALVHTSLGILIAIFLIDHLYVCTIGKHPLNNFKSMINGYHDLSEH